MSPSIFVLGPGYIGRHVIDALHTSGFDDITVLTRGQQSADQIAYLHVKTVFGSLDDADVITAQTKKSDVVVHTATADHLPSVVAILEGVRQRAKDGHRTVYLHTSGTGVLIDLESDKAEHEARVYSDKSTRDIDSLSERAIHRHIDLTIHRASEELKGKVSFAILIPPLIYGYTTKHQRLTIQIPTLVRFALQQHGYAGYVGKGDTLWSAVHVRDLARAYAIVLHHLLDSTSSSQDENIYYFCEATQENELTMKDVAQGIADLLRNSSEKKTVEVQSIKESDYQHLLGVHTPILLGKSSRSRAHHVRQLGWEPREPSWKESLAEEELPAILKERRA